MKIFKRLFLLVFVSVFIFLGVMAFMDVYKKRIVPMEYSDLVHKYSKLYNIPQSHVFAIIKCESDFDSKAQSSAGAIGLMQLMPDTYIWLCNLCDMEPEDHKIDDPETNIKLGCFYLAWLYERFTDWDLVFAAYNAGHNRVKDWMNDPKIYIDGKLENIPYKETAKYVKKVNSYISQYESLYPQLKER